LEEIPFKEFKQMIKRIAYAPLNGGYPENWNEKTFVKKVIGPQKGFFKDVSGTTFQDMLQIVHIPEILSRIQESRFIDQVILDPTCPSTWLLNDPYDSYKILFENKRINRSYYVTHGLSLGVFCGVELVLLSYITEIALKTDCVVLNLEHDGLLVWSLLEPSKILQNLNKSLQDISTKLIQKPVPVEIKNIWIL
jgi:hypothetical protein